MDFRARADGLLRRVLAFPDGALAGEFTWRERPRERRHGLYMVTEELLAVADRAPAGSSEARALGAHVIRAAWDLHAVLLPLETDLLDREPGSGERTLRAALSHTVVEGQAFWTWLIGWWCERAREAGPGGEGAQLPFRPTREDVPGRFLADPPGFEGDVAALVEELDGSVRAGCAALVEAERLGLLHQPEVSFNGSRIAVEMAYYPRRWAAHLREHTVEVEKTLALLGRAPREQERIARVWAAALGDLEASWWRAGQEPPAVALEIGRAHV